MTSEEAIKQDIIRGKTAGNLYDFIQASAWRNSISESLSSHLRAAIKKIFSATAKEGEFWRDLPLPINISARIAALRANNSGECSEKTIEAYRARYDRSLQLYYEHLLQASVSASHTVNAPSSSSSSTSSAPATPSSPVAPATSDAQALVMQKVLAASLKFQQEVLDALSLLTVHKGGSPPAPA